MKKITFVLGGLVLIGLIYSYEIAKGEINDFPQTSVSDHIIIRYNITTNQDVVVYSGGNTINHFPITKEQKADLGTLSLVIDLMNKYSAEGYVLTSTSTNPFGTECFLRKVK